jgi:hypothetical protein
MVMYGWLAHRVSQAKEALQDFSMDWGFILNSPASEAEISTCESELGVRLPSSYCEFLLEFNGVELFYPEQRNPYAPETLISIKGTQTILDLNKVITAYEDTKGMLLLFCYIGLGGDYCGFDLRNVDKGEVPILECASGGSLILHWMNSKIADSFSEWLEKIFDRVIEDRKDPLYWDKGYFEVEELEQVSEQYREYGWCNPSTALNSDLENNPRSLSSLGEHKSTVLDESHMIRTYKEASVTIQFPDTTSENQIS